MENVAAPSKIPDDVELEKRPPKINVLDLIKTDLPPVPRGGLTRSAEYYRDESEGGFVVFRVEDTLFKVCFNIWPNHKENAAYYDYLHFFFFLMSGAQVLLVARAIGFWRHV